MTFKIFFRSNVTKSLFTKMIAECGGHHHDMGDELDDGCMGMIIYKNVRITSMATPIKWVTIYARVSNDYTHMSMEKIQELQLVAQASTEAFWELLVSILPEWEPSVP